LAKKHASAAGCKVDSMTYRLEVERGPKGCGKFVSRGNSVRIDAEVLDELPALFWSRATLPFAGATNAECS
jgi:hypothetical protein